MKNMFNFKTKKGIDLLVHGSGTPICTTNGHRGNGYPKANCIDCTPITKEEEDEEAKRDSFGSGSFGSSSFGKTRL